MFGRRPHLAHSHQGDEQHPLRRQAGITIAVAVLLAIAALLLLPPHAHGNFVYWVSEGDTTIGRAKINGTGANNGFITGLSQPHAVAVDSKFIYFARGGGPDGSIGRANLDGSGVNPNFIPSSAGVVNPRGVAVSAMGLFWANGGGTIGRANLDGSGAVGNFIDTSGSQICGLAADQAFLYWLDASIGQRIGRAAQDGSSRNLQFISGASPGCGIAVDASFIYWGAGSRAVGRAPVAGGTPDNTFIANAAATNTSGVAVTPQYVFWGNPGASDFIGRANLDGSNPNPNLISGPTNPHQLAAAPSNKITINSVTRNKKKGTAVIDAKVPGPGQVTLSQTSSGQDVNATAAAVKQIGLTITGASSFKLPVKPKGKTAKKLKKQVAKKGKGKVKVTVFVTFVPAGVAGVPNSDPVKVKLVRRGKKRR